MLLIKGFFSAGAVWRLSRRTHLDMSGGRRGVSPAPSHGVRDRTSHQRHPQKPKKTTNVTHKNTTKTIQKPYKNTTKTIQKPYKKQEKPYFLHVT